MSRPGTLWGALVAIHEARAEAEYHLARCGEPEARAERAEAIVHGLLREAGGTLDVRDQFARRAGTAPAYRGGPVPSGAQPIPPAPAPEEWAFGPWVAVSIGAPIEPGRYQVEYNYGKPARVCDFCGRFGTTWGKHATRHRRAYRIGEWHEWHGGECPLDGSTLINVRLDDWPWSRLPATAAGGFLWDHVGGGGNITHFRPVAA